MEPIPFALILWYMSPVELMGTFHNLKACLGYSTKWKLDGMCVTLDLLPMFFASVV